MEAAIEVLRGGHTRAIDLVRVTSDKVRYFLNVSAGGFSGLVNEKLTPEMKKTWGPLAYLRSAAAALPRSARLSHDPGLRQYGKSLMLELYNVVVANGRYVARRNLDRPGGLDR